MTQHQYAIGNPHAPANISMVKGLYKLEHWVAILLHIPIHIVIDDHAVLVFLDEIDHPWEGFYRFHPLAPGLWYRARDLNDICRFQGFVCKHDKILMDLPHV
jgi:hypothetical protein